MSNSGNPSNSSITVEQEKAKLTIANGVKFQEGASDMLKGKSIISPATEKEILDEIKKHCDNWNKVSYVYVGFIILFGLSAVTTSVLVSIYTGEEKLMSVPVIKVLAGISTISLAVLTAFNLVTNGNNARNAWRSLNAALLLYKAGSMSIEQLIEQYQKGETQVGNFNFNYGPNADKSGTYTQDVAENDEIKKQKQDEANEILNRAFKKDGQEEEEQSGNAKSTKEVNITDNNATDKNLENNEQPDLDKKTNGTSA